MALGPNFRGPIYKKLDKPKRAPAFKPATQDRDVDYSPDQLAFMFAMDEFKRMNRRPFPTCCEVLGVIERLGYKKEALWPTT